MDRIPAGRERSGDLGDPRPARAGRTGARPGPGHAGVKLKHDQAIPWTSPRVRRAARAACMHAAQMVLSACVTAWALQRRPGRAEVARQPAGVHYLCGDTPSAQAHFPAPTPPATKIRAARPRAGRHARAVPASRGAACGSGLCQPTYRWARARGGRWEHALAARGAGGRLPGQCSVRRAGERGHLAGCKRSRLVLWSARSARRRSTRCQPAAGHRVRAACGESAQRRCAPGLLWGLGCATSGPRV
eukprot:scaffold907_cov398-Prasinococcus_capsulatus_cf.AAC.6